MFESCFPQAAQGGGGARPKHEDNWHAKPRGGNNNHIIPRIMRSIVMHMICIFVCILIILSVDIIHVQKYIHNTYIIHALHVRTYIHACVHKFIHTYIHTYYTYILFIYIYIYMLSTTCHTRLCILSEPLGSHLSVWEQVDRRFTLLCYAKLWCDAIQLAVAVSVGVGVYVLIMYVAKQSMVWYIVTV